MLLNSYNLYTINTGTSPKVDEVESIRSEIMKSTDFGTVREVIIRTLGDFDGELDFDYPDVDKKIRIYMDENKIIFSHGKGDAEKLLYNITWYREGVNASEIMEW